VLSFNDCAPAEAAVIAACDAERLRAPSVGHALPAHVVVARVARQPVRVVVGVRVAARRARLAREHDRAPVPRPDPQVPDATLWTRGGDHREAEEELSPRVGTYAPVVVPDPRCVDANGVVAEVTALGRRGSLLAGLHRARPPAAPLAHYDEDEQAAPRPH